VDPNATSRKRFDAIFAQIAKSNTLVTIWREVYGQDYPNDARPYSFVTVRELGWLASALNVGDGRTFVDLACGQGGPSLFVARETGAAVIGVDSSLVAVASARAAAAAAPGVSRTAAFIAADAAATGLRAESVAGVMSVDALQLMPDRNAVIAEVFRLLKPGGRFAFTTWLSRRVGAGPPLPVDYRPLLESANLFLNSCHEPPEWERRELAVFERIRESAPALITELGEPVAAMLLAEAAKMPEAYPLIRRVNVLATKGG
jgi:SAM-dependent methyltransferase